MKYRLLLKIMFVASCLFQIGNVQAQVPREKKMFVVNDIKFGGYVITEYQYSNQENAGNNSFGLRLARVFLEGKFLQDFSWKMQMQVNGNTSALGKSPRLLDAFGEWQKYKFFRVRLGQFKRPFTFENPINPITQGFMSFGQNVLMLSGFNDRSGEHASNGRDIGLQIQGDFMRNSEGRELFHYQIGVYNGQGINVKDVDQQKDLIGGLWVMPIKGMRLGIFGWTGSYARKGNYTIVDPVTHAPVLDASGTPKTDNGLQTVEKRRYAVSGEYVNDDWTFRSEYVHSTGYGFKTVYNTKDDLSKADVNYAAGDKADGLYALVIAPIVEKKLHVKARYDMYRPQARWSTAKTRYEIGLNYEFSYHLKISGEYAFINDRSLDKPNYSMMDVQVAIRF